MKTAATVLLSSFAATVLGAPSHNHQARQATSSSSGNILPPSQDPWYTAPANFETAVPGTVLKVRAAPGNLTKIASNSSAAYNILYRTTNSRYKPTWAVTTLFLPATNITTSNDQLLSYQIPYDSAYINASPSYSLYSSFFGDISEALGRGWYVSVPDYEGPLASFTAGVISGHATLDSIRAVLNTGFGLTNTTRSAMWGYSGGALASEWAAELQIQYAPELNISGAALGGLTPNVTSVLEAVNGQADAGLIPAGILGLASQYPELETYLQNNINVNGTQNATTFFNARNQTLVGTIVTFAGQDITGYFKNGAASLLEPIPQMVTNTDGLMGYHGVPKIPIFAYKAIGDEVSHINDTDTLINRYCAVGATIKYDRNSVGNHGTEFTNGHDRALSFLDQVLGGTYNATGCQISNVTVPANSTSSSSPSKREEGRSAMLNLVM